MASLEIAIDQEVCISCGMCANIEPGHFFNADSGLAYVKEYNLRDPREPSYFGPTGWVAVNGAFAESVIEAVEECPVNCIELNIIEDQVA